MRSLLMRVSARCCGALMLGMMAMAFALPAYAKPALVYTSGLQESDKAFIDMARKGAMRAKKEIGADYAEYRLPANEDIVEFVARVAQDGYSPIIAIGSQHVVPILNLADEFPKTRFTLIDGLVPPLFNNVQSITFNDHEGAFLVGMIAAYNSNTKRLGFIGGMDIPLIRNFGLGFMQGAKFVNPTVNVKLEMLGTDAEAWSNPQAAFELAQEQYDKGVDVIFAAAGGSGLGVLSAAQKRNKLAIGVDTNQNALHPGHVLTSMIKRVDNVVFNALKTAKEGRWNPGIKHMGLKEAALDYAVDEHNAKFMNESLIEQVETAKEKIISGLIKVDAYSPE